MTDTQNQTPARCAIYLRSATGDRASLREQEEACRAAAARHQPAWQIDDDLVFTDAGSSGMNTNPRPGLNALQKRAAESSKPFALVLVASPDRIGRDLTTSLHVVDVLASHGVGVHIASMGLDSRDLDFRKLLCFDTMYQERLARTHSLKVSRGHLAKLPVGGSVGGCCYGYRSYRVEPLSVGPVSGFVAKVKFMTRRQRSYGASSASLPMGRLLFKSRIASAKMAYRVPPGAVGRLVRFAASCIAAATVARWAGA